MQRQTMNIFCLDDEKLALALLEKSVRESVEKTDSVYVFQNSQDLISQAQKTLPEVAFLDISLETEGTFNGLKLAEKLREINPDINIIFVTGNIKHALAAWSLHASGFVTKPITPDAIQAELSNLRHKISKEKNFKIKANCFGNFEIYNINGEPLLFQRTKTKEFLAYLIYRRGAGCSMREISNALFEDDSEECMNYSYNLVCDMKKTLSKADCSDVLKLSAKNYAIDTSKVDCDYYRFLDREKDALASYSGEFMNQYSWAEDINAYLNKVFL